MKQKISNETIEGNKKKSCIKGIKYISFYETSGYGNSARAYLVGLKNTGLPLTWTPMIPGSSWGLGYEPFFGSTVGDSELDLYCNKQIEYDTVIIHTVPEYFPKWKKIEKGKRIIGYTVWETDTIPHHWFELLNGVDHLLVPSLWNKEIFKKSLIKTPINVIPHIICGKDTVENTREKKTDSEIFTFYTIGDWTARKAIWNTLKCYMNTFTSDDPTLLIIKTTKKDLTRKFLRWHLKNSNRSVRKILSNYNSPPKTKLIVEKLTKTEINQLHRRSDCFISLCRSEGWGLGAFEAIRAGNPVIMTGYGGQRDYLNRDMAYVVDYNIVPVKDNVGKKSYSKNQNWAEPDISHASGLMKEVFINRKEAKKKATLLYESVFKKFNEKTVINKLLYALEDSKI